MTALPLKIELQPKQRQLLQLGRKSDAAWLGYGGALGGAKSAGIRYYQLIRRFENARTNGLIFRRKRKELNDNHITPLFAEFPQLRQYWRAVDRQLCLPNGSILSFGHGDTEKDIEDFLGNEYMDVAVDQAEGISEQSILLLHSRARWPGVADKSCKTLLGFNPGGPGAAFLRRIFVDRTYRDNERAEDYEFIQAFGWDNAVWVKAWLDSQNITLRTYYRDWSEQERMDAFLQHSEYGHTLLQMPEGLRNGWLYGRFDSFAGQYFENFSASRHVVRPETMQTRPWFRRWAAIDWGYQHNAAVLWATHAYRSDHGGERSQPVVYVYREFVKNRKGSKELASIIADMTGDEKLDAIYVSPDTKQHRDEIETVYDQMNRVLRSRGLPDMTLADNERVGGWRLMYDMLGADPMADPELVISDQCKRLIGGLPMMSRDPKKVEDCEKFDSNDQGEGGDDVCLVGGTMIETAHGAIPIESVKRGDVVLTPRGSRKVLVSGITGQNRPVVTVSMTSGASLTGTGSHEVSTERGWVRLDSLRYGDKIASLHGGERRGWISSISRASDAARRFLATATTGPSSVAGFVLGVTDAGRADVYNLTVENEHCYYANGVLVHNCDAARYLLKSRPNIRKKPWDAEVSEKLAAVPDMTEKALEHRRLLDVRRRRGSGRVFRLR